MPQQPPRSSAPPSAISFIFSANSSGPQLYEADPEVLPLGRPAFGFTHTGIETSDTTDGRIRSIRSGPAEQFIPKASAPIASATAPMTAAGTPVNVRPSAPKTPVTTTGRSQLSFAQRIAALSSASSPKVSISTRSQMSAPALTVGRKASYASSKLISWPTSLPVGPMSSAVYIFLPQPSEARLTLRTAAVTNLSTEYPSSEGQRKPLTPNVFVLMISAPASIYSRCAFTRTSGRVIPQISGDIPAGRPLEWRRVPIPPSKYMNRSDFSRSLKDGES